MSYLCHLWLDTNQCRSVRNFSLAGIRVVLWLNLISAVRIGWLPPYITSRHRDGSEKAILWRKAVMLSIYVTHRLQYLPVFDTALEVWSLSFYGFWSGRKVLETLFGKVVLVYQEISEEHKNPLAVVSGKANVPSQTCRGTRCGAVLIRKQLIMDICT